MDHLGRSGGRGAAARRPEDSDTGWQVVDVGGAYPGGRGVGGVAGCRWVRVERGCVPWHLDRLHKVDIQYRPRGRGFLKSTTADRAGHILHLRR